MPTFNEADNIDELLDRVAAAIPAGMSVEVLFVDDSTDNTPEVIEKAAGRYPMSVSVHHREVTEGGLGGAVVAGIALTGAPWIVVMDADLQHPPELMPKLVLAGAEAGAELVVASRYADGGSRSGLAGAYRTAVSGVSTALTKAVFPGLLSDVSDPMSGFFAIRREAVGRAGQASGQDTGLRPLGYKILLELAVRCRPRGVVEVPYEFRQRFAGESKSTVREGLRFLRHLTELRTSDRRARMVAVGLIGISGFLPNLVALWVLTSATTLHYAVAEVVANQLGVVWNFLLPELLIYRGVKPGRPAARLLGFAALSNGELVLRIPILILLVTRMGLHPLPATALSLVMVFVLRFLLWTRWSTAVGGPVGLFS